ncbi:MAG: hypothetical protein HOG30_07515 [Candidatus Marinimicrobia bacterium]|jgi:hypothetical protein|nr:hypothetical protein [Candidatus Neomarinimicrobiota bacterium]
MFRLAPLTTVIIAEFEDVDESYILRIIKMVYLSPKIQETILLFPHSTKYQSLPRLC